MTIKNYLKLMIEKNASDIFYRAGTSVRMRINNQVVSAGDEVITIQGVNQALKDILSDELRDSFSRNLDVDFALYLPELDRRFRVSVFKQRNCPSIVIRSILSVIPKMEDLNLPVSVLKQLSMESRGLILLTGTMGSGKSTTIATMIENINVHAHKHILTIEEPIESVFDDKNSIINQRELRHDVSSYPVALRAVTLQSPDVIYIGNIRDNETMSAAMTAAETGVLVLSTLHTVNAAQSIERIINLFPPHQHGEVKTELSSLLKGVISLRLLPRQDMPGRIPAYEVLLLTPTIGRLIREGNIGEISHFIEEGEIFGMCSFNQSLLKLVQEGKVSEETALNFADNKDEFKLVLKGIKKA
ncbi:MAG: PilT/PilU family type 4a pilus ATPase [Candidatus Omnitrophota bacterium]